MRLPQHLSHSAREQLERCAKSFFLARIARAPKRPALWLAGGSGVHEATEAWDREQYATGRDPAWSPAKIKAVWDKCFGAHLDEMRSHEPNEWSWRSSASEPIDRWNVLGPQFVQSYLDWRLRSPYVIWTTPTGEPAIELDVSGYLPGCEPEIKGYVDRIFEDPVFEQLIDVDLKTGKRPPKDGVQFGTYNALMQVKYGTKARLGVPFMNRRASLGTPFDLAEYTPEAVGSIFGRAWQQIQDGEFPTDKTGQACYLCDVSAACHAKNGPLAHLYDPDHPANEKVPF